MQHLHVFRGPIVSVLHDVDSQHHVSDVLGDRTQAKLHVTRGHVRAEYQLQAIPTNEFKCPYITLKAARPRTLACPNATGRQGDEEKN